MLFMGVSMGKQEETMESEKLGDLECPIEILMQMSYTNWQWMPMM